MKKGLAIIFDPHNLYQFLWYYCTYEQEYEWDALCLPNGANGTYMEEYCSKAGIFKNVFKNDLEFINMSIFEQIRYFATMVGYACVHKQKKWCYKLLKQIIDIDQYECIEILTDSGIVPGAVMQMDDKRILMLEDGGGDYPDKYRFVPLSEIFDYRQWRNFLLASMGYSCPGHRYILKTTKNCEKFSSRIENMPYRDFKSINRLYDMKHTDVGLLEQINERVYGNIDVKRIKDADAVLFTENLHDFTEEHHAEYIKKIVSYIEGYGAKNVLLKRHPRDVEEYNFSASVDVFEVEPSYPAEILLPYLKDKIVYFFCASSLALYINDTDNDVVFLYLDGLDDEKGKARYYDSQILENHFRRLGCKKFKTIHI